MAAKSLYSDSDWERRFEVSSTESYRSPARRDYARVIHSAAFRRLQGKTQLFPGEESDFFRNRLTHSLEVAQIAKSIAIRLNHVHRDELGGQDINPDLVEVAGLLHDIGHPPFGHNGESALDKCMKSMGGFEGNAQTLRIITKLEKKEPNPEVQFQYGGADRRVGLNLTYRTIAAILKYDSEIYQKRAQEDKLAKGYYSSEKELVNVTKAKVCPNFKGQKFKTIECQIMDIADDIAYSTYDLEDSFKAGFLSPLSILASPGDLLEKVAQRIREKSRLNHIQAKDVAEVLINVFSGTIYSSEGENLSEVVRVAKTYSISEDVTRNGYIRTTFTAELVGEFISGIKLVYNPEYPMLSEIAVDDVILLKIEVLKHYTYLATIMSSRLKVAEFRGSQIVETIFESLHSPKGYLLLPNDFQVTYQKCGSDADKARIICDYIAGMTDRYALEFYERINSTSPQTIFKPL